MIFKIKEKTIKAGVNMGVINIYENKTNHWIEDVLLDELGDTYVQKNVNGLKEKYGIVLKMEVFEQYYFEDFVHYTKWLIEKRGFKTTNRKSENY